MEDNPVIIPRQGRGLHFAHLNVRSMLNKHDLLKIQLQQLQFDFFTVSESWLTNHIPDAIIDIEGYNLVRLDRDWNMGQGVVPKKGGGVGLYIKEKHVYSTKSYEHLNSSKHAMGAVWIEIIRPHAKNILLATIYRPPDGNEKKNCEEITQMANSILDLDKHELFIMGDFNINMNNKQSNESKHLAHFQELKNLKQLITDNTRANSRIDLIFTNSDNIFDCGVMDINISDLDLIYVINKKLYTKHVRVQFRGRSYKNYDKDIFVDELTNHDWTIFSESDDPEYCWDFILTTIEKYIDSMCPMKERKVRQKGELWITNEILELIYDKDMAWKQAKKSWCGNNQLTVNIKKTKLVLFGTKEMLRNSRHIDMYMGTEKLQYVNDYMYLGIKLDNKFTFELHANEWCRHVIHKNYILAKIRRYINAHQALTIYKSMILPYFCYGDVLMHNLKVGSYDRMQTLQNKALRLCLQKDNRCNVNQLHRDGNTNMLVDREEGQFV